MRRPAGLTVWRCASVEGQTGSELPSGTALFVVTSKVKAVLEWEQATNIKLESLSEVVRPTLPSDGLGFRSVH